MFKNSTVAPMHPTFKRLMAAAKGMGQSELARALGESEQTVTNWKTRGVPRAKHISIALALGCDPLYLAGKSEEIGDGKQNSPEIDPEESGFTYVSRVRFKLSAGVSGFAVDVEDGETPPIFFRKDWFARNGYRPEALFAVRVSGDSMVPSLFDGDLVVVNTADNTPRDGEVFAVNYEGELVIKRIRLDGGACWLDSDAADQIRFRPRQCGEGCFILGRVVYKQSERI